MNISIMCYNQTKSIYEINRVFMEIISNPIVESIFEIRFKSKTENVKELLLGLLYVDLKDEYPKVEPLQFFVPREIVGVNPGLIYQPSYRLRGEHYIISLGEQSFSLSCIRPYRGWKNFSEEIKKLFVLLKKTGLLHTIERVSMKYVNLLPSEISFTQLNMLNLEAKLGSYDLTKHKLRLYSEIEDNNLTSVVQIIPQTDVQLLITNDTLNGLLLDIDTFKQPIDTNDFWNNYNFLDELHDRSKNMFFEILTPESLDALGLSKDA